VSTKILAPLRSSTADFSTPPVISVKTKLGLDDVIDFSDSSNDDVSLQKAVFHDFPPFIPSASFVTPSPSPSVHSTPSVPSTSKPPQTIVQCLCRLGSMPGCKNVLKKLDYDKLKIQEVNHLPPRFDGTQLFVLPAAEISSSQTRAKSLDGMEKQYDGHVWTKTQTTNITNDVGLAFRSSTVLAISNAKTLVVITFNASIVPPRLTTQNLKVFLKILSLSLALCHHDLFLSAGSANNLPNALLCAMPKS
jgi:hypothetical protein